MRAKHSIQSEVQRQAQIIREIHTHILELSTRLLPVSREASPELAEAVIAVLDRDSSGLILANLAANNLALAEISAALVRIRSNLAVSSD